MSRPACIGERDQRARGGLPSPAAAAAQRVPRPPSAAGQPMCRPSQCSDEQLAQRVGILDDRLLATVGRAVESRRWIGLEA
jgi:hypothetical protein